MIGKYVCIEGSSKNVLVLRQNLSNIPNLTIHQSVVTSDGREVHFYDEESGHLHQITATKGKAITSTTVADILTTHKVENIALCKIDIEGAEVEIIQNNPDWLRKINLLFVEIHKPKDEIALKQIFNSMDFKHTKNQTINIFYK